MKKFALLLCLLMLISMILTSCSSTAEQEVSQASSPTAASPEPSVGEESAAPALKEEESSSGQGSEESTFAENSTELPVEALPAETETAEFGTSEYYVQSTKIVSDADAKAIADKQGIQTTTEYFPVDESKSISMWYCYPPWLTNYLPSGDMADRLVFQQLEEETGVHVDFISSPLNAADAEMMLLVASGSYPDIFYQFAYHYAGVTATAIEDEVIIDISSYVDEYCPSYSYCLSTDPELKLAATNDDGSMSEFIMISTESIGGGESIYLRQDWLSRLELEIPKTYDELHDVLTMFRDNTDVISPLWIASDGIERNLMYGYDISSTWFLENGDTAAYPFISDGYREYLTMLSDWYNEGLLSSDWFSQENNRQFPSDSWINNGGTGCFQVPMNNMGSYSAETASDPNWELVPIGTMTRTADEGTYFGGSSGATGSNGFGWFISAGCEDIELVCRWCDYWYTEQGYMTGNYGKEDTSWVMNPETGKPDFTELITNNPEGMPFNQALALYTQFNGGGMVSDSWKTDQNLDMELVVKINDAHIADGIKGDWSYPGLASLNTEEDELYTLKIADIETYVSENTLKFIIGDINIRIKWDEYVQTIEEMGIGQCIDSMQSAYDRYLVRIS